jgi:hypothetical protein
MRDFKKWIASYSDTDEKFRIAEIAIDGERSIDESPPYLTKKRKCKDKNFMSGLGIKKCA